MIIDKNLKMQHKLVKVFNKMFEVMNIDIDNSEMRDTPTRMAKMYSNELLFGYNDLNFKVTTFPNPGYDQIISEIDIPFYSLCSHHGLPFFGVVHIGYLPDAKIIGISKLDRISKYFSRKFQVQENLTQEIAEYLMKVLEPRGCMVIIEARHLCKEMRGAERSGAVMITSAVKGEFSENSSLKNEFLDLIKINRRLNK